MKDKTPSFLRRLEEQRSVRLRQDFEQSLVVEPETRQSRNAYQQATRDIDREIEKLRPAMDRKSAWQKAALATWNTGKAAVKVIVYPVAAAAAAVTATGIIATGIYIGNGNDPANIPENVDRWLQEHPGILDGFNGNSGTIYKAVPGNPNWEIPPEAIPQEDAQPLPQEWEELLRNAPEPNPAPAGNLNL